MTVQEQTRIYTEIEERLAEMIRRNEAALREFREEFDKSERAKQQIRADYQRRRLQRLAERL
ncbi:hypothetical protein [Longimicrobium sp.]|uniref:hypothetical protein n=1 Tax=Longimicrobium sp. TaxID=2029185 RepID=UPI002E32576D|nr:hypothetical protein [Longimicrobium sp.]HEX6037983.1 hypothetical protein [Longimicrobium sp.]